MRTVSIGITCDATGIGSGPQTHEGVDADDLDLDAEDMVDAPLGWLAIQIVRVRPNPKARDPIPLPQVPATQDQDALNDWMAEVQRLSQLEPEPAHIVDEALLYLSAGEAHKLDTIMPGCFDGVEGFEDLAALAQASK